MPTNIVLFFFFQAEDGIRDLTVTGVQTCALPICEVAAKGGDPRTIAESLGVIQVADTNVIEGWVTDVLADHPSEVERYKKGETKLMPFFVGQLMRKSKGKADPKLAQRVLEV